MKEYKVRFSLIGAGRLEIGIRKGTPSPGRKCWKMPYEMVRFGAYSGLLAVPMLCACPLHIL